MTQKLDGFPIELTEYIYKARNIDDTYEAVYLALECLDLTSLNETDSESSIKELCSNASTEHGDVAAICVLPQFVKTVAVTLSASSSIKVATVISFPSGIDEPNKIMLDTMNAIDNGADEVDLVFNWNSFIHEGEEGKEKARAALNACKEACSFNCKMKVIMETGKFTDYKILNEAILMALSCGADFVKTSTGKSENTSGASMEAVATILQALKETGSSAGIKISGGIRDVTETCAYMELAEKMMGHGGWINKDRFRIGSASLLGELVDFIDD